MRHHLGQVLIGGGDHPGIGVNRLGPAHPDQDLFLHHPEQLGLAAEAQIADLVEKQRAAGGRLELALPGFLGVGKRPFFVAEELALQQRFGDRRAIDRDERPVAAAG